MLHEKAQALAENTMALAEADATVPLNLLPTVLLGTLNTTSGASQTLSGLDLTPFKFLRLSFLGVSTNSSGDILVAGVVVHPGLSSSSQIRGVMEVDLHNGAFFCATSDSGGVNTSSSITGRAGELPLTTADTSITVAMSINSFDAGSIRVYGVK